jgi:hypothetical protein
VYNLDRVLAVAAQPRVPYQRGLALLNALHSTLSANQLEEANEVGTLSFSQFSVRCNPLHPFKKWPFATLPSTVTTQNEHLLQLLQPSLFAPL